MSTNTVSVAPYVLSIGAAPARRLNVLHDINAPTRRRAMFQAGKKEPGATMTPAPAPDLRHASVCPSCEAGYHGEHSDAVAFGLLQCDCHCHSPKCVAGPPAMSGHLASNVVRVGE